MAKKCYNRRLQTNMAWHCEEGTQVGIIQAVTVHIGIFQVPFPFEVNKLCSDNTKICLDIGPDLLVSKL